MTVPLRVLVPALVWLVVTTPVVLGAGPITQNSERPTAATPQSAGNGTPTLRAAQEPAANHTESALSRPPNVTSWNDRYVDDYTLGGADFSARPSHVTGESCCRTWSESDEPLFNNTYAEIFSITPSTIVHARSGTERYAAPNGTVRVVSNFRLPARLINVTERKSTDTTLTGVALDTELLVNGTVVDTSSSTTPELQYRNLSGRTNLTVRTVLTGTVQEPDNSTESYTMTVTDSEMVRVQDLSALGVTGQRAWLNTSGAAQNDSALTLLVPGLWHRAQFDNGLDVHSQWYYYTRVGENWTEWNTTASQPGTAAPDWQPIAPYEVHAVPVTAGHELTYGWLEVRDSESGRTRSVAVELSYPESTMAMQPALSPEIELDRAGNSTTADRFTLRSSSSLRDAGEFTVYGIVHGRSVNYSVDTTDPATVHEVNLTAEVLNMSEDGTRIRVSALPREGESIKQGRIIVERRGARAKRQLSPADDGTVIVELNRSEVWEATLLYEPAVPWWEQSRSSPVVATEISFTHTADLPLFGEIINFIVITGLVFLPLYLLLYGFDILAKGNFIGWYEP